MAELQHRAFALAHASHQDSLVQQYRLLLVGFETAIAVIVVGIALAPIGNTWVQAAAMALVLWKHQKAGNRFRDAIEFRQKDVDWAQSELMLAERTLPGKFREFTRFKVYQDRDENTLEAKQALFLSDSAHATPLNIQQYFFSHASQSRGKAAELLLTLALSVRVVAALAVLGPSLARLLS